MNKYKIPNRRKTYEQICYPKEFELQMPQKFLAYFMGPNKTHKGILVFHKIGSGKTCTAINIAEKWKHERHIIVVTPASLINNFRSELRSECAGNSYMTPKQRELIKRYVPGSDEYNEIINKSDKLIDKHYDIMSYQKFVRQIKEINFKNKLLIIDEVQNIVSLTGSFYKTIYDTLKNAPESLRIVLLSATPMFDKPIEIALTMNLLRIPNEFNIDTFYDDFIEVKMNKQTGKYKYKVKNLEIFKEKIRGYVSYFRGAPPYVFPEIRMKYVRCKMSKYQYSSYLKVLESEKKQLKRQTAQNEPEEYVKDLTNNFFIGTRIISNIAFPNETIGESGLSKFTGKHMEIDKIGTYSTKFYELLKRISKSSGPILIYSNFLNYGGIKSFAKVLRYYGYKDYAITGQGKHRYAIWSGEETIKYKEEIRNIYNQKLNINGSKLKIILFSSSGKEGWSAMNVQQIHILEPYWNDSRLAQIIGRGVRYCSHKNLPEDKRFVKVYIYLATATSKTIDEYIVDIAYEKNIIISKFEMALKEIAIDCDINKNANVYEGENDIKCDL